MKKREDFESFDECKKYVQEWIERRQDLSMWLLIFAILFPFIGPYILRILYKII